MRINKDLMACRHLPNRKNRIQSVKKAYQSAEIMVYCFIGCVIIALLVIIFNLMFTIITTTV